ncbi:SCO family protein [Motiliproteus sp. SC1-56]|uniref:SCO family protein n=1 Tax=Motiliproteus sp. SC1-56 TaxID=2799565 RepID=UPI001A8DBCFF|nr:SCO family protein [Motiliproteus sp. SC1-56]
MKRLSIAVLVLAGALVLIAAGYSAQRLLFSGPPSDAPLQEASLGGDFTLTSANGPVSLSDFRDLAVIISFGYTSCPDVCPTGLANLAAGLDQLSSNEQAHIQPLFVSVDPQRDTPERLAEYAAYFHPRLLGVTGTPAQLDAMVKAYGAFYRQVPLPDSALEYAVDHSTRLYLLDGTGKVRALLHHDTPPAELAAALRALL